MAGIAENHFPVDKASNFPGFSGTSVNPAGNTAGSSQESADGQRLKATAPPQRCAPLGVLSMLMLNDHRYSTDSFLLSS